MKTTLEERLAAASANMKLTARKAFRHPITSILSLCVVAGIAATIASFSQTSEPAAQVEAAAITMPVAHTLTNLKGQALEGIITGKTATDVSFTRNDGQKFTIKLDTLSEGDQTFIAGLAAPDPKAVKKPTVLFVCDGTRTTDRKTLDWLTAAGFEVTIGQLFNGTKDGWPKNLGEWTPEANRKWQDELVAEYSKKTIIVDPLSRTNPYDIVWIPNFQNVYSLKEGMQTGLEVSNYRLNQKKVLVVGVPIQWATTRNLTNGIKVGSSEGSATKNEDRENYVKVQDNVVFCDGLQPPRSKKSITEEEMLAKVGTALETLLKK